jgi:hypothetical protein
MTPIETAVKEWLDDLVAAAAPGSPLDGAAALATVMHPITTTKSVMVGPCESQLAPAYADADDAEEFAASVLLVINCRVATRDGAGFLAARDAVIEMGAKIAAACFVSPDLGGRVRDALFPTGEFRRAWGNIDGQLFAVGNLPLVSNVVGQSASQ